MGLRISFFKTPKHRVFNYMPRYSGEDKEHADAARPAAEHDSEVLANTPRLRHLRSRMHDGFQQAVYHNRRNAGKQKTMRIIILATLAALLFALFYFTKLLEVLFMTMGR